MSAAKDNEFERHKIAVLGSTGSIGVSTLDVIERHASRFDLVALTAHTNVKQLVDQAQRFEAKVIGVSAGESSAAEARELIGRASCPQVLPGLDAICEFVATPAVDTVVAGIVGAAGLKPVLAAVAAGKRVLIANKEPMVMLGATIMQLAKDHGATLLPLDSEHNAVFQCVGGTADSDRFVDVKKITLTASGGPFRTTPIEELAEVTPTMACAHPNWEMGAKISVDSATMMNKGLEIIEACHLFGVDESRVDVVVHPQSVIHSWVEFVDGSVIAHMANPDMRVPIAHALAWPNRFNSGVAGPDLIQVAQLNFEPPDHERFPSLTLARQALRAGGTTPTTLNAANEVAVERFLNGDLRFVDIAHLCADVLARSPRYGASDLESVLSADRAARTLAREWVGQKN